MSNPFANMTEEVTPIITDSKGRVMPPKNNKIALVDADTLVYQVCVTTQEIIQVLPEEFYTKEQWQEITDNPTFDEEAYRTIDVALAMQKLDTKIEDILLNTGCIEVELHFSSGKENFRYSIEPDYKANRDPKQVPEGIPAVRELAMQTYTSELHTKMEADDAVVAKYKALPEAYILVAVDKDVLYSVVGKHWNYYQSVQYSIDPKWIEVDELTAMKHQFMQTLTGDRTDNVITGLKRVGKKTAEKILKEVTNKRQAWRAVLATYRAHGKTAKDARKVLNLVSMHLVCYDVETLTYDMGKVDKILKEVTDEIG